MKAKITKETKLFIAGSEVNVTELSDKKATVTRNGQEETIPITHIKIIK